MPINVLLNLGLFICLLTYVLTYLRWPIATVCPSKAFCYINGMNGVLDNDPALVRLVPLFCYLLPHFYVCFGDIIGVGINTIMMLLLLDYT